jgi:hypothetical protein
MKVKGMHDEAIALTSPSMSFLLLRICCKLSHAGCNSLPLEAWCSLCPFHASVLRMFLVPLRRVRQLALGSAFLATQLQLGAASIARFKLAHASPNCPLFAFDCKAAYASLACFQILYVLVLNLISVLFMLLWAAKASSELFLTLQPGPDIANSSHTNQAIASLASLYVLSPAKYVEICQ